MFFTKSSFSINNIDPCLIDETHQQIDRLECFAKTYKPFSYSSKLVRFYSRALKSARQAHNFEPKRWKCLIVSDTLAYRSVKSLFTEKKFYEIEPLR
jgi:hypothetical protein